MIALIGIGMGLPGANSKRAIAPKHAVTRAIGGCGYACSAMLARRSTPHAWGAAGAFFGFGLTDFRGAADLGIIAGGGLVLCLISGYTTLPALLDDFSAKDSAHRTFGTLSSADAPGRGGAAPAAGSFG